MKNLMIKNIKRPTCVAALIGATMVFSCTSEFEEVNKNPNAPEVVTADLLLAGVERDMVGTVLGEAWGIGNIVIQHTSKNQFVNEDRYLWGELTSIWNAVYDNMRDVTAMIDLAETNGDENYVGVSLVLRAWMFSLATDCYGDIPYSEAIKAKSDGIYYPVYDKQEDIYNGILADLERANTLLKDELNVKGDLIYG